MRRTSKDFDFLARATSAQRVIHQPFKFDFIGDDRFTIGVPALASASFKRAVAYAAKCYFDRPPPSIEVLSEWGKDSVFEPPTRGYYPLFRDISYRVVQYIDSEIRRILEKPRPIKHHGAFACTQALIRLQMSFHVACLLMRQHHWVELACILKLILEQLAWILSVRGLEGEKLFRSSPTKAIRALKAFYPGAAKMYGLLNQAAHVEPTITGEYIEFRTTYPSVFLASARNTAPRAYFLLLLTDMYLLVSEYVHADHYKRFKYLRRCKGGVRHKANREILADIKIYRKKLIAVRRRNPPQ